MKSCHCPRCKVGRMVKHKGIVFCQWCGYETRKGRRKRVTVTDGINVYDACTGEKIPGTIVLAWREIKKVEKK